MSLLTGWKSTLPSQIMFTDGDRSAVPTMNELISFASGLKTCPPDTRVAPCLLVPSGTISAGPGSWPCTRIGVRRHTGTGTCVLSPCQSFCGKGFRKQTTYRWTGQNGLC